MDGFALPARRLSTLTTSLEERNPEGYQKERVNPLEERRKKTAGCDLINEMILWLFGTSMPEGNGAPCRWGDRLLLVCSNREMLGQTPFSMNSTNKQ